MTTRGDRSDRLRPIVRPTRPRAAAFAPGRVPGATGARPRAPVARAKWRESLPMNCPSCSAEIPDGSNFCGICGARIAAAPAPAPAPAPASDAAKTAAFEAGQLPFGGGSGPSDDMGPTLIGAPALPAEETAEQVSGQGAEGDDDMASTMVSFSPPSAEDLAAASQRTQRDPTPAPARPAGPSVVIDPSMGAEMQPPTPTAIAPSVAQPAPAPRPAPAQPAPKMHPAPAPAAPAPAPKAQPAPAPAPRPAPAPAAQPAPSIAKPTPARQPTPAPAPTAPKPVLAKPAAAPASAPAPAAATGGKPGEPGEGGFRETMWFMDALDPEKLSSIDTDDIRDRTEKFEDDGSVVDSQVRRQFSLNIQEDEPAPRRTQMREARAALAEAEAGGGSKTAIVFLVFLILGGLGAAAWFLFLKN